MIAQSQYTERTDAELMLRLREGDMEPLGEIYRRYGGQVRSLLWRILPDRHWGETDDLAQDVFETLYEVAERFDVSRALRPWIFGIAVRRARSWQRKHWVRSKLLRRYTGERRAMGVGVVAPPDAAPVSRSQIDRALGELPRAQREVLLLYTVENLKGEQIAEALGVNLNTVWTRLRRARLTLRESLAFEPAVGRSGGEP